MKPAIIVVAVAAIAIVAIAVAVVRGKGSRTPTPQTFEDKLAVLGDCGFRLAEPFTQEELLKAWAQPQYEEEGYELVLVALGSDEEDAPYRSLCGNLWHFDTECIEDHGAYKRIVERMVEMAQGSLPLTDIQDYVDVEQRKAWFAFKFRGREVRVDCEVNDDWVDTAVFATFVRLLQESEPSKVYVYYDLRGQDCLIGCVSRENLAKLNKLGLKFEPLS